MCSKSPSSSTPPGPSPHRYWAGRTPRTCSSAVGPGMTTAQGSVPLIGVCILTGTALRGPPLTRESVRRRLTVRRRAARGASRRRSCCDRPAPATERAAGPSQASAGQGNAHRGDDGRQQRGAPGGCARAPDRSHDSRHHVEGGEDRAGCWCPASCGECDRGAHGMRRCLLPRDIVVFDAFWRAASLGVGGVHCHLGARRGNPGREKKPGSLPPEHPSGRQGREAALGGRLTAGAPGRRGAQEHRVGASAPADRGVGFGAPPAMARVGLPGRDFAECGDCRQPRSDSRRSARRSSRRSARRGRMRSALSPATRRAPPAPSSCVRSCSPVRVWSNSLSA